jgi:hypothetical protein
VVVYRLGVNLGLSLRGRMQSFLKCCNGVYESHAAQWICASHPSHSASGRVDEEIIGDDGMAYRSGGAMVVDDKSSRKRSFAPMPISPAGNEEDKETAKQRLQRLIRDFAHDAVGPGMIVEAQSPLLTGMSWTMPSGSAEVLLRMDRRLSRIELWPLSAHEAPEPGFAPIMEIALQQVTLIVKGSGAAEEAADRISHVAEIGAARESCTLTIVRRVEQQLRLCFDSPIARDRAYTCLRIFQMSVDQAPEASAGQTPNSGNEHEHT